jgi:hypothetical protein
VQGRFDRRPAREQVGVVEVSRERVAELCAQGSEQVVAGLAEPPAGLIEIVEDV